jgi:hypothetical protein
MRLQHQPYTNPTPTLHQPYTNPTPTPISFQQLKNEIQSAFNDTLCTVPFSELITINYFIYFSFFYFIKFIIIFKLKKIKCKVIKEK